MHLEIVLMRIPYSPILLILALIAALFFDGTELYLLSLVWLTLLIWGIYQLPVSKKVEVSIDITTLAVVGFVLWMLVALYWHPVVFQGVIYNWRLAIFFCALVVTAYLLQEDDINTTLILLFTIGLAIGLLTIYQTLIAGESATGLFINKNNNGAFLNLFVLPLMSFLLFRENSGVRLFITCIAFVLLFFALLQVVSRGALIAMSIATFMVIVVAVKERRLKGIALVSMLALLAVAADAFFSTVELRGDLQSAPRWHLYASTVEMIMDSQWYGAGNGMWRYLYPAYRNIQEISSAGIFVHNDYLQFLYELGIPGLTLLSVFAVTFSHKTYLLVKENDLDKASLYLGLYSAIAAVAIHSIVTFNLYISSILLVLGFYSGVLLRSAGQRNFYKSYSFSLRLTWKKQFVLLILVLVSGRSIILPGYADAMARGLIDTELFDRSPIDRYHIYSELRAYAPSSILYPLRAANVLALSGEGKSFQERQEIFYQCRTLIDEARRLNRFSIAAYLAEADLLSNYRDIAGVRWHEDAIPLAEKALDLNPGIVTVRLFLAQLLVDVGEKEKALGVLLERHDHYHNRNMVYYRYGRDLAEELGNRYAVERFSHLMEELSGKPD